MVSLLFLLLVGVLADTKRFLSSKPEGAPAEFDCMARKAGFEYSQHLQSFRSADTLRNVFDGLEMGSRCGYSFEDSLLPTKETPTAEKKISHARAGASAVGTYYVSPNGKDSNSGTTRSDPFKTIQRAVEATRGESAPAKKIILLAGTYYLTETVKLYSLDSGLNIVADNGAKVDISGGKQLNIPNWKAYKVDHSPSKLLYPGVNNVYDRISAPGANSTTVRFLGNFANTSSCVDACEKYNYQGLKCYAFTHFHPNRPTWGQGCYAEITQVWGPHTDSDVTSGRILSMNVWVADLSAQQDLVGVPGLRVNGFRAWRGRYPNSDPERAFYPDGWILGASSWLPPKKYPEAATIVVDAPNRNAFTTEFQQYTLGVGGPCSIFDPPESYWCSSQNSGGGAAVFSTTTGLVYAEDTFLGRVFSNMKGAVVHAYHWAHWALWMFEVDSYSSASRTIGWSYGGFQGARGAAGRGGSDWYIENLFEEVESPNEYFYDAEAKLLYYFSNTSAGSPPSLSTIFEATNIKTLIHVQGAQSDPVKNLVISGITFKDTNYTFMDPHGVPSGGDWAMQRSAALFFEGTSNLTVSDCTFSRLDGNALILSGYNRDAVVQRSEFAWIGDSAVVLWGYTQGIDGTSGDQPRGSKILYNLFREIGIWEKQSSPFFQAKSCLTRIEGNIAFNGPRALINFNDGFGGGNVVTKNFLFNPNRETSDQGPFNSWDRQPFLTEVLNGTPSLIPAYNYIHENFMICNYGSNLCIDNDDGSAFYKNYNNFHIYGGHKSDFGGHSKFTYNTINAYSQVYTDGLCAGFGSTWVAGYEDGYYNNTCIQDPPIPYIDLPYCNLDAPQLMAMLGNNKVYNSQKMLAVTCGSKPIPEDQFQKLGFDKNTTVYPMPSFAEIISWGRKLLNF